MSTKLKKGNSQKKTKRCKNQQNGHIQAGVWTSVKRFAPYYKPYKKLFLFDLLCVLVATAVELTFPKLVEIVTNDAQANGTFSLTLVLYVVAGLAVLRLLEIFCRFFITKWGHMTGAFIERDLREEMFEHLQKLPHDYYDSTKIGVLMSRISTDLFEITEFAHHCPEEFFIATIKIVGIFTILMFSNIYLTLCIFFVLPFMVLFSVKVNRKMRRTFKANRVQMGELNAVVEDSLAGVRVVKSFTNEEVESQKFKKGNKKFLKIKEENYQNMATFISGTRALDAIMYCTILVFAAVFQVDVPTFITYLLYASMLLASVKAIADYTEQLQKGITAFERFSEIMDEPVQIQDKKGAITLHDVQGDIKFDDVSFHYQNSEKDVLSHLSLDIKKGELLAIVGPSGGGKTTISNLVPRFYDVTGGSITVDGKDVRECTLDSLRKNIGVVQQDVYLFWGSVLDNIRYGKIDATREEVIEAAKLAGAHEFIAEMPEGYDSYVGERGVKLSGGQKQRISIARVFLKNPPILILDEATSALDNQSEVVVQKSLDKLSQGRTTIVIAHRLSTIRNATKIVLLTDKGIQEQGTHKELMLHDGLYKKLYDLSIATQGVVW